MTQPGNGGSQPLRVVIRKELLPLYRSLSPFLRKRIRSMLVTAVTDPEAARVVYAEGQGMISGMSAASDQTYYLVMRFTYDPAANSINLQDLQPPLLISGGPH